MDFSSFISQFSGTNQIDIITTVSNQIGPLTNTMDGGGSYYGRYFCLGNLLIQFSDFSQGVNANSSSQSTFTMNFPTAYDSTPYTVILNSVKKENQNFPCNLTLISFNSTSFTFRISTNNGEVNFLAIGPRPSRFYLPITYQITNLNNVNYTTFNNNGYTGLIFEYTGSPTTNQSTGTCNIAFSGSATLNCIVVGGGGGGGCGNINSSGGGGGAGGGIVYTSFTVVNQTFNINVGCGGLGSQNTNGGTGNSSGSVGGFSFFGNSSYTFQGNGGGQGASIGTTTGYAGGAAGAATNSINNTGGGGGGSGGGAEGSGSVANPGPIRYLNSSYNPGKSGTTGTNYNGGNGGSSYYQSIVLPFLSSTTYLYCGNGASGGSYYNGGNAGYTSGGTGYASGTDGANAIYGFDGTSYFYGNGGGGGANQNGTGTNKGGSGGNGVVILWF